MRKEKVKKKRKEKKRNTHAQTHTLIYIIHNTRENMEIRDEEL